MGGSVRVTTLEVGQKFYQLVSNGSPSSFETPKVGLLNFRFAHIMIFSNRSRRTKSTLPNLQYLRDAELKAAIG